MGSRSPEVTKARDHRHLEIVTDFRSRTKEYPFEAAVTDVERQSTECPR